MMLQPWMGSDLTNDDLVKESSMVDDYTHTLRGFKDVDGVKAYRVEFHAEAQGTEHRTHDLRPGSTDHRRCLHEIQKAYCVAHAEISRSPPRAWFSDLA